MAESTENGSAIDPTFRKRTLETLPGDAPLVYANNVRLWSSLFDVVLNFGTIMQMDEETITAQDVVRVAMSPQHAKALVGILDKHLREYEAKFGRLPEAPQSEENES